MTQQQYMQTQEKFKRDVQLEINKMTMLWDKEGKLKNWHQYSLTALRYHDSVNLAWNPSKMGDLASSNNKGINMLVVGCLCYAVAKTTAKEFDMEYGDWCDLQVLNSEIDQRWKEETKMVHESVSKRYQILSGNGIDTNTLLKSMQGGKA